LIIASVIAGVLVLEFWCLPQRMALGGELVGVTQDDPVAAVRHALQPLFEKKPNGDLNETASFTPEFKALADRYFSNEDNARSFDADWLLGVQEWDFLTPTYSTYMSNNTQAVVR
jgi:hypothetical protein